MFEFPEIARLTNGAYTEFAGAVFDFDGTLGDSMWVWGDIDRRFCEEYGLVLPDDYQDNIVGLGFEGTADFFINELGLQMSLEECCAEFNRLAGKAYAEEVALKPGALRYLELLAQRGVPCGIASSLNINLLSSALERNGALKYIKAIRLCDDYATHKSEPKIYRVTAEAIGADLENCIVFEDIVPAIRSIKSVGTCAVALIDESNEAQNTALIRELADVAINDFTELL